MTLEELIKEIGIIGCCGCCYNDHDISDELKKSYELGLENANE
jgi:bacterioferritin-associated ferredoxin